MLEAQYRYLTCWHYRKRDHEDVTCTELGTKQDISGSVVTESGTPHYCMLAIPDIASPSALLYITLHTIPSLRYLDYCGTC